MSWSAMSTSLRSSPFFRSGESPASAARSRLRVVVSLTTYFFSLSFQRTNSPPRLLNQTCWTTGDTFAAVYLSTNFIPRMSPHDMNGLS